jgi:antitoxin component of MazEF toxin-antitoxin module
MPLIRKIWKQGNSYCITLPRDWLESFKSPTGELPKVAAMDVNTALTIHPVVREEDNKGE